MFDKKLWAEAVDIAKDQARHGKLHYCDLQKASEAIYRDLLLLEQGPIHETSTTFELTQQNNILAIPSSKFKHEHVDDKVRCAECGKLLKSITITHLKSHGLETREEYMQKHGITNKDMQGVIERNPIKGDYNPLNIMASIMKDHNIKRNEVSSFITKYGFKNLKDLMKQAKETSKKPFDFLNEKISAKKVNKKP